MNLTLETLVPENCFSRKLEKQLDFDWRINQVERAISSLPLSFWTRLWTRSFGRAMAVSRRLCSGSVWVNNCTGFAPECETGGCKESGLDRAAGVDGFLKYTEIKHSNMDFTRLLRRRRRFYRKIAQKGKLAAEVFLKS